ncbi:hypothetical protein QMK19_02590 [Streptomyces sp. H10-C2]|uniref:hypothetical protein n=1 Tax=unclassified Streptomyces TaxID=2593676 RepID=UPI0024BBB852|nr:MULTISPECIES: hypothetical protein [unclassified Streptomyces]MDJ0344055.1 hypothetical protein [Streptomyces sp. PH10-H1]MDJ0368594.1 hypothetical protein [Streptomyces sp. H10-C2]
MWSHEHEQTVLAIQDVVVDNTHLTPRIPERLKAAVAGQAAFVIHDHRRAAR